MEKIKIWFFIIILIICSSYLLKKLDKIIDTNKSINDFENSIIISCVNVLSDSNEKIDDERELVDE